jgi:protein SCO1
MNICNNVAKSLSLFNRQVARQMQTNFVPAMKKKIVLYAIFFVLLFAGFMFALTRLIPGYTEVKMPIISYVKPFSFTDQEGKPITQSDVNGKVYVAEYFFSTCKGICPKMNRNMKLVYDKFRNEKDFRILSHTVDPETDSVGRLKFYADSLGANPSTWLFLTGRKDSLYKIARNSYLLDDPKNNNEKLEDQFIHTQFFALVDRNGQVRKIYDGLKKDELNDMMDDIQKLLNDRQKGARFANGLFNNNPG